MKVGICVGAMISNIEYIELAEELGYDSVWVADSQMIWSDCYATLALAATRTSRIRLGTGVSIAGTRIAPVTASAIATINELAPGRVFLGLGTGHTAMRTMGQDQMRLGPFKEYVRVVRDLLEGKSTPFTYEGLTREVAFMHKEMGYYRLEPRIPIHISALGPLTQRWAGGVADGVVMVGTNPETIAAGMENVREGARRVGRALSSDLEVTTLLTGMVLRPGETTETERALDEAGVWVSQMLHAAWHRASEPKRALGNAPSYLADVWEDYCAYVEAMDTPAERRYQQVHVGHCSFLPDGER
ncbi:MAG: LLM class flavin-dependent oxidoreductase, partial [Dehalococcoidia bacterium]